MRLKKPAPLPRTPRGGAAGRRRGRAPHPRVVARGDLHQATGAQPRHVEVQVGEQAFPVLGQGGCARRAGAGLRCGGVGRAARLVGVRRGGRSRCGPRPGPSAPRAWRKRAHPAPVVPGGSGPRSRRRPAGRRVRGKGAGPETAPAPTRPRRAGADARWPWSGAPRPPGPVRPRAAPGRRRARRASPSGSRPPPGRRPSSGPARVPAAASVSPAQSGAATVGAEPKLLRPSVATVTNTTTQEAKS